MKTFSEIAKEIASRYGAPLTEEAVALLTSIIERRELDKGEYFLAPDEIDRSISYVGEGLMRQFYYKNGRDVTEHFTSEGYIIFCIDSLFKQEPTRLMAEALEPTVIYSLPYKKLQALAGQSVPVFHLLRKLLEAALILSQQKADSWRFETARERYERFIREYPEAARRASVNHIASYLLMTPESLSRVRAGLL